MLQFLWHKVKRETFAVTAGCEVQREKIQGSTPGKKGDERAQLEDLLIALADRRSFPETLCFVERGMVGDTCSTESVVVVVGVEVFPPSVLTLPVNDPERGHRQKDEEIEK